MGECVCVCVCVCARACTACNLSSLAEFEFGVFLLGGDGGAQEGGHRAPIQLSGAGLDARAGGAGGCSLLGGADAGGECWSNAAPRVFFVFA